ncbi:uncharacterized protein LOC130629551 isoform X1 [Hydractinia symbiolongicarpus]|uniref:uncharacterized protein LOC130629551 isoform X1 n=1 Tax=Hydractinia symbiolongicarpus TaxID=13093 RepID=UPI00254D673C|nr:uncharacterized protein LOC130629551 isoform X1 [Hydractinia symbiolongicarpus]
MGVTEINLPKSSQFTLIFIIIYRSLETQDENQLNHYDDVGNTAVQHQARCKRKRLKPRCYDFREFGLDARRRGSKHQRRKQNFCELLQMVNEEEHFNTDDWLSDDHMTAFAELFIDEGKMKVWECFINLPEDRQEDYLASFHNKKLLVQTTPEDTCNDDVEKDEINYLLIDKKIRDMLRSKKLAYDGLLKYYEDDVISCMEDWFPSIVVLELETAYDRMLVYALCQYMKLSWNTIKLQDTVLVEIELPSEDMKPPDQTLTDYIKNNI